MEELKRIHHSVGKTIIYVTYNQAEAMTMSERIAVINAGSLEQFDTPKIIYEQPKTIFSAEFIGSPATNMFEGEIVRENGNLVIDSKIGIVYLNKDRALAAKNMIGQKVCISIRPQNIHFIKYNIPRRRSDAKITLTIEIIVTMGDRSLVVGRTSQNTVVRFMATPDEDISIGDVISVVIDGRRIHLFNTESRRNIFIS